MKVWYYYTSDHFFTGYDGNGNVTLLTASGDGTAAARYEYGPFGETIRASGNSIIAASDYRGNPFRFSTKYTDGESDLLYYGHRYYNPSTGRWLSRDPIGDNPRRHTRMWNRETMNPYGFVKNDPVRRTDRLGLYGNRICGPDGRCYPYDPSWVCPRKCGPDYTAAVNAEIAALRTWIDSFPLEEANGLVDVINTTHWFGFVAGSLNYAAQADEAAVGQPPFNGCPSGLGCHGTITLCGQCVTSDVPGNIMYGLMREALIGNWLANFGATVIEPFDGDPESWEEDYDVFPLGNELYRSAALANHGAA